MPAITTAIIAATAIAGVAAEGYGMYGSAKAASKANAAQKAEIAAQQQQEALRQQLAGLDYNRKQLELLRNVQKSRAASLQTATNQGAQYGSALPGAYGQAQDQYGNYRVALNQNFQLNAENSGLNQSISQDKIQLANAQQDASTAQGWMSLGNSLVSAAGTFGKFGAAGQGLMTSSATGNPGKLGSLY